jgi:hypothetical protein
MLKVNESSLLVVTISIYLEFRYWNFDSAINILSLLASIYVFFFNIIFFYYCLKRINNLEIQEKDISYLDSKFDELSFDL